MPLVPSPISDFLISLYTDFTKAKCEAPANGASGFITSVESEGHTFLYAVTARHVIDHGATVIRINATEEC